MTPNQAGRANRGLGFWFGLGHIHVWGCRGRSPRALGTDTLMALSQEMSKFLNEFTGTPRDKFRQRIDSESDAFIDELLREIRSDSFERAYVLGVQQKRRHQ